MDALLSKHHIDVSTDCDVVVFKIGRAQARLTYASAFTISQRLRLHSKAGMDWAGDNNRQWVARGQLDSGPAPRALPLGPGTGQPAQIRPQDPRKAIGIVNEGELVVMRLGANVSAKFHYEVALKLSEWLRLRAREAKAWAGDTSRGLSVMGLLHDATPGG